MRGDPQAVVARLPVIAPRRRLRSWIADTIDERRRIRTERLEVMARLAHEERRQQQRGRYVPEVKYRVRPR